MVVIRPSNYSLDKPSVYHKMFSSFDSDMRKLTHIIIGCLVSFFFIGSVLCTTRISIRKNDLPISTEELYDRLQEEFVNAPGYRDNDNENQERQKRDSGIFDLIAGISGGSVLHTDKDNISSAIDLLTSRMVNQVIILRQQLRVNKTTQFTFYVDKTVNQLAVKTGTSCCKPNIMLQDPTGNTFKKSSVNVTVKVDTTTTLYVLLNGTVSKGMWTVIVNDSHEQDYDVTIYGSSLITYSLDFCDSKGNSVSGQPISDSNQTYVKITPSGTDLTTNWTYLILKTMNGTILQQLPFGELKGSKSNKVYLLQIQWPNTDVHVAAQGIDNTGKIFTRELPTLIQPLGIRLHLDDTDIGYITSCETPTKLSFTVTNLLSTYENITCQVSSSNSKFEASVSPDHFRLVSHKTRNASVIVTLLASPTPAESTDIYITAMTVEKKAQYVTKTLVTRNVICKSATRGYTIASTTSGTRCIQSAVSVLFVMYLHILL